MNNELKNTIVNPVIVNEKNKKNEKGRGAGKDAGKNPEENKTGKRRRKRNKRKDKIPKALREQVWLKQCGEVYSTKCPVIWCKNKITVYDFQCGHNIPESKGGLTRIDNLIPLCSRCNLSMGNTYSIDEWNMQFLTGGAKDIGAGVGMGKDDVSPAEDDDGSGEEEEEEEEGEACVPPTPCHKDEAEEAERAEAGRAEAGRAEAGRAEAEAEATRGWCSILCGCFGWNGVEENTGVREKEIETVNRNVKLGNSETGRRTQTETREEKPKNVARCI